MADTDVMRTIKFTTVQGIRKTLKLKKCGTTFALYTPNHENAEVKIQVNVKVP